MLMTGPAKIRSRARVIKGSYRYVDGDQTTEYPEREKEIIPKGVMTGHIRVEEEGDSGKVAVAYDVNRYGVSFVETVESRNKSQLEQISKLKQQLENQKKQVDQKIAEAYRKGIIEGKAKGVQEGKQSVQKEVELVGKLVESVHTASKEYFLAVQDQLAQFALEIAERMIGHITERDRNIAATIAGEVIRQAIDKSELTLYVNEEDYEILKNSEADLKKISQGIKQVKVDINNRIKPGGVILETAGGSIDASIETMIEELYKAILPDGPSGGKNREEHDKSDNTTS